MENIDSPAGIADIIAAALRAAGCSTGRPNADAEPGGDGFLDIRTPDGQAYRIGINADRGW
jgi:hypothetical protein